MFFRLYIHILLLRCSPNSSNPVTEVPVPVREIVEGLIDQIRRKVPGKPGKQCGACDYFQICRFR
ncbi:MAG: hypothetical protein CVV33_08200 [Methanomicrobiales archaeon HGW-Methanomicrobiales-4]|nr:MAG: hypothetical protein CVV33_08200 [Methanomicrobiales archaeon HGW-Methanomicrobiales-4]